MICASSDRSEFVITNAHAGLVRASSFAIQLFLRACSSCYVFCTHGRKKRGGNSDSGLEFTVYTFCLMSRYSEIIRDTKLAGRHQFLYVEMSACWLLTLSSLSLVPSKLHVSSSLLELFTLNSSTCPCIAMHSLCDPCEQLLELSMNTSAFTTF